MVLIQTVCYPYGRYIPLGTKVLYSCTIYPYFTFTLCPFHAAIFSCCSFFVLQFPLFFHIFLFFMFSFFRILIFSCCTFIMYFGHFSFFHVLGFLFFFAACSTKFRWKKSITELIEINLKHVTRNISWLSWTIFWYSLLLWWWRSIIVFVIWFTDERRLAFFPETIVRDPHHRESSTRR